MLSIVGSAEKSLWINNPLGTLLCVSLWLFGCWVFKGLPSRYIPFYFFFESAILQSLVLTLNWEMEENAFKLWVFSFCVKALSK